MAAVAEAAAVEDAMPMAAVAEADAVEDMGASSSPAPMAAVAEAAAVEDAMEVDGCCQALPCELVAVVLKFVPIRHLAAAARVCKDWAAALEADFLWKTVVYRRFDLSPTFDCFGAVRPKNWRDAFKLLVSGANRSNDRDLSMIDQECTYEEVQNFLKGIIRGYVPTADGLFTFQQESATPVHYRWKRPAEEDQHGADEDVDTTSSGGGALLLGGEWEWSVDRVEFFATSTTVVERGLFAQQRGDWQIADANEEIVTFLHHIPLVPFFVKEFGVRPLHHFSQQQQQLTLSLQAEDDAFWRSAHSEALEANCEAIPEAFRDAVYSPSPTTPCVATRLFTCHLFFSPAIHLRVRPPFGWEVVPQSDVQHGVRAFGEHVLLELLSTCELLMVPTQGAYGEIHRSVLLWEHLYETEQRLREQLGIADEAADLADADGMAVRFPEGL